MLNYTTYDELFETMRYPAGECHVRARGHVRFDQIGTVEAHIRSFEGLGQLLTADRILRHNGALAEWFVPYFPFARHDRRRDAADGLELQLALDWVRDLTLTIVDPHSELSGTLRHIPQSSVVALFEQFGAFDADPVVVIPDAGATKKAMTWLADREYVQATKTRDVETGRLSRFEVLADDLQGAPCIIVDDICDGGGTFLGLARELEAKNAGPIRLAISHGLFTRDIEPLLERFERIYTLGKTLAEENRLYLLPYRELHAKGQVV